MHWPKPPCVVLYSRPMEGFLGWHGSSASKSLMGVGRQHMPADSKVGSASPDRLVAAGEDWNHRPGLEREPSRGLAAADSTGPPLGMGTDTYRWFRVSTEMLGEPTCPALQCEALHCLALVQKGCCRTV